MRKDAPGARLHFELTDRLPILSVSESINIVLGFTPDDLCSSKVRLKDLFHRDDGTLAQALFSPHLDIGVGSFNFRLRHSDGRIRCIRTKCTKKVSAGGHLVAFLDLQDGSNARRRVGRTPLMTGLRALMEDTHAYVFVKACNHTFVAANTRALPHCGFGSEDLVGRTDYHFLQETCADTTYEMEERILAGQTTAKFVYQMQSLSGETCWLEEQLYPIKSRRGEIIGLWGIATDITEHVETDARLRESDRFLQESQRIAGIGSYSLDIQKSKWMASDNLDALLGITPRYPHTTDGWLALVHPDDCGMVASYFSEEVIARGTLFDKTYRIVRPSDGAVRWLHGLGELEFDDFGNPRRMIGTIQDITDRRKAEEKQRLAASVFAHAREGIVITDADGAIIDVNEMFTKITGYTREEIMGRNPRMLQSGRHRKQFYTEMWRALTEVGHWSGEVWNRGKGGHIYAEYLSISAVPGSDGRVQHYVGTFSDITSVKEQEQRLRQIAHYDAITGLPNRVLLTDRLNVAMTQFGGIQHSINEARRRGNLMAVAFLDLDWFKEINDRHGHDIGDQLLAAVAAKMKAVMRKGDTLARIGGDEFVAVMLDFQSKDACMPMLNRLINAVCQPVTLHGLDLQISVSIGVTFYPQEEEVVADQLMRQADQAMYQAKVEGKNKYHIFDFNEDRTTRGRHLDLDRIRQALEMKEFALYYQPLVNMREGKVIGAEALIRWQHPDRGLLLPGAFLPVIEDHPLAVKIGEWILDTVLTQVERWRTDGLDLPVHVNVAARQLQEPYFVERLAALLGTHPGVPPSSLTLEIVETSALENLNHVSQTLANCRKLGVSTALDDFGTGYSSLSYLRHLPADVVKIDWSFVRDVLTDPENMTIIEAIIGLAGAFRRTVIAEGVETVEHGLMLLRMGCELAQGFGIARPMPTEEIPGWVTNWRPDPRWKEAHSFKTDEKQFLHAAVSHRFMVTTVESYLRGELYSPPNLHLHECRFSALFLRSGRRMEHGPSRAQDLDGLHRKVHSLAQNLVQSKEKLPDNEMMAALTKLQELSRNFWNQLVGFKAAEA